jgi:anti-sigma regulatory factor (Ser/Thr protein kinase)
MIETLAVRMTDSSKVAELRRMTLDYAKGLGWSEHDSGQAALIATEMGTNLIKHARDGAIVIMVDEVHSGTRLQLVSVDHGPGISDVEACLQDGYSTAGSPGTGLGAVRRMATSMDLFSAPGKGTVLSAELLGPARASGIAPNGYSIAGVCIPCPGESVSGDGWDYSIRDGALFIMVCDGLGHGIFAAEATKLAIAAFRREPAASVTDYLARIHEALRTTRGAAAAVVMIDRRAGKARFCGIGNIAGSIVIGHDVRHMVSHNGILGHAAPRIAEFTYPWNDACQLVMHSDGLSGRWRADEWPGLWQRSPALIAGALCRDWDRGRDDVTAVIARPS